MGELEIMSVIGTPSESREERETHAALRAEEDASRPRMNDTPDPTTPALLSAARLAEIRLRDSGEEADDAIVLYADQPTTDRRALLAHLAALTAPAVPDGEALPALAPEHTPPPERFDGEVWRGRVKVDDDWEHVAVATVNGVVVPMFFDHGRWRGFAVRFGNEVMAAWARASDAHGYARGLAAGRSEGEAEQARLADKFKAIADNLQHMFGVADGQAAEIARLTAELAGAHDRAIVFGRNVVASTERAMQVKIDALAAELAEARDEAEENRRTVVKIAQAGTLDVRAARRDGAREEREALSIRFEQLSRSEHDRGDRCAASETDADEAPLHYAARDAFEAAATLVRAHGEGQGS